MTSVTRSRQSLYSSLLSTNASRTLNLHSASFPSRRPAATFPSLKLELRFQVVHPDWKDSDAMKQYEEHRDKYIEASLIVPSSPGGVGLEDEENTAQPTELHSSKNRPIYILREELGRGGFGTVYKVRDVSTGLMYAGKEFYGSNWKKEVEIMKQVSHENIVQFKDFTDEGKPLLVMEYLGPYRSNSLWRK